jgi:hypothetical protein
MGKKPYWETYSHFADKFWDENKKYFDDLQDISQEHKDLYGDKQ